MLSVPPELTDPQAPGAASAPSIRAVMEITSASNLVAEGQRSAWSGLDWEVSA